MSMLMDLTRAMVVGMIGIQTVLSSVVDVPLTKVGHNYALNFTIDGGVYNNIVSAVIFPLRDHVDSRRKLFDDGGGACRLILAFFKSRRTINHTLLHREIAMSPCPTVCLSPLTPRPSLSSGKPVAVFLPR